MPPREFIKPRAKREELKTYREIGLRRDLKSKIARKRVEADGKRRVLGDGTDTHPYLIVETARYKKVRLEIQRELLVQARQTGLDLPADQLLQQLKPRIESLVYTQLSTENAQASLGKISIPSLGRTLTTDEQAHFSHASEKTARKPNQIAQTALNHVLGSIEQRQVHNPAKDQAIWAQLVGPDAAMQTQFDRIDANTQTAYFRCSNSVLSSDIQRRRGLVQKLAKALNQPIRQLRAKF